MKLNKCIFLMSICLILLIGLSFVSAQDLNETSQEFESVDADEMISIDESLNESVMASENTFEDVQRKIDGANAGNTIELSGTYHNKENSSEILVNKSLTIKGVGQNTILNASKFSRVFNIAADNVVLQNLIITEGFHDYYGGGIYCTKNGLTIINCTFTKCNSFHGGAIYCGYSGGGISSYNGPGGDYSKLINCTFDGNIATTTSSHTSFSYNGGAIYYTGNNCNFLNLTFTNNRGAFGGAMHYEGYDGIMDNCIFVNNYASYGGALLWGSFFLAEGYFNIVPADFKGKITNCNFTENSAKLGGAFYCASHNLDLINSYFKNNNYDYQSEGVAIYWATTGGRIINCTFEGNYGKGNGIIFWSLHDTNSYEHLGLIDKCIFINNELNGNGGIYVDSRMSGVIISNSIFKNNSAYSSYSPQKGGAINLFGNDCKVHNCEFESNSAGNGAAIYNEGLNTEIYKSLFKNNEGVTGFYNNYNYCYGGAIYSQGENIFIDASTFIKNGNPESCYGGALYLTGNISNVENCEFDSNFAFEGGAIYLQANESRVYNSKFISNKANLGSAISLMANDCRIVKSEFTNNIAKASGTIYVNGSQGKVYSCKFSDNSAFSGGGVYWQGSDGVLHDSTFMYNEAEMGGAVYWNGINGEIYSLKFVFNDALDSDDDIYAPQSEVNIYDCIQADVNIIELSQSGGNYLDSILKVKVIDGNKNIPVNNAKVLITFSNNKKVTLTTNNKGMASYSIPFDAGNYTAIASLLDEDVVFDEVSYDFNISKLSSSVSISKTGTYYQDMTISVKVTNEEYNMVLSGKRVLVKFSNGKSVTLKTNNAGIASYNVPFDPGTYVATATVIEDTNFKSSSVSLSNIEIIKAPITMITSKLTAGYKTSKYFEVKIINSVTKKVLIGIKIIIKIYTGKKYKKYTVKTGSNGVAKYKTSKLKIGKHKVLASIGSTKLASGKSKSSSVKVIKTTPIKLTVRKDSIKKGTALTIKVKNKKTGKYIAGVKIKLLIYTGKTYKPIKLVSKKVKNYCAVGYGTNALSVGTHTVKIIIDDVRYTGSDKSSYISVKKRGKWTEST